MPVLLGSLKAAGKRCCSLATAFEKARPGDEFHLQRITQRQKKALEFVVRPSGRGFRGKIRPAGGDRQRPEIYALAKLQRDRPEQYRAVLFLGS
jgi:hypothetical protein